MSSRVFFVIFVRFKGNWVKDEAEIFNQFSSCKGFILYFDGPDVHVVVLHSNKIDGFYCLTLSIEIAIMKSHICFAFLLLCPINDQSALTFSAGFQVFSLSCRVGRFQFQQLFGVSGYLIL